MTRRRKFHRRVYLGILREQRLRCACGCGVKLMRNEGYQFDHHTAVALGGADTPENLRALRTPCHKRKSAVDIRMIRKADRIAKKEGQIRGLRFRSVAPNGRKMQSRGFKGWRKFNGERVVRT